MTTFTTQPVTLVPLTPALPGTRRRPAAPQAARAFRPASGWRAQLRTELPGLLASVSVAVAAAAATSAWLVESIHLF